MTMTDSILLVREAKTCSYVLVVQTPSLCGQPGFRSRLEAAQESLVRCRQIIDPAFDQVPPSESTQLEQRQTNDQPNLIESDHPLHLLHRRSRFVMPTPAASQTSLGSNTGDKSDDGQWDDFWKRAVEALMKSPELQELSGNHPQVFLDRGENGEIIIEILEEIPMDSNGDGAAESDVTVEEYERLTDMLRNAGFDVKNDGETKRENDEGGGDRDEPDARYMRDEL
ncbi:hypothetical protein JVU11DRAFT_904 [Chiua virens]|nr:hypothetical protein JVU11DRAFT_904 [Chiua virens]